MLRETLSWLSRAVGRPAMAETAPSDKYELSAPSPQNAINLLPGWNHAFPAEMGLVAGPAGMFVDPRIDWAAAQFGSLEGKRVLELGPLEGSHTYMLERHGAERIDAVEANKVAFLRCLVAKEVFGLQRARFHLGDFVQGLLAPTRYDMIVACGVLYHMPDPLLLLERMAARTDCIYLWTHYFDEAEMPHGDARREAFRSPRRPRGETVETRMFHGVSTHLHQRSYYGAGDFSNYCGGAVDRHYWLEKAELVAVMRALGFQTIELAHEEPQHTNGPALSLFARR